MEYISFTFVKHLQTAKYPAL